MVYSACLNCLLNVLEKYVKMDNHKRKKQKDVLDLKKNETKRESRILAIVEILGKTVVKMICFISWFSIPEELLINHASFCHMYDVFFSSLLLVGLKCCVESSNLNFCSAPKQCPLSKYERLYF